MLSGFTENASNNTPFEMDASNVVNRESTNLHQLPNITNNKKDRIKTLDYPNEMIEIEGFKLVDLSMSQ